jgi:patatin-like phospholipase/acyl hydrolase
MYSTKKLYDLIADEIDAARDWTLNDSPIDLLITAKRVPDGKTWYFVRDNRRNSRWTGRLKLVDCATASAAAPTYFEPWMMAEPIPPVDREPIGRLVDGGVGVTGNPVYQACIEAFYYTYKFKPEETTAVSLGTGRYRDKKMPGWIWPWLGWILGELLESSGEQQTKITQRTFPEMLFTESTQS